MRNNTYFLFFFSRPNLKYSEKSNLTNVLSDYWELVKQLLWDQCFPKKNVQIDIWKWFIHTSGRELTLKHNNSMVHNLIQGLFIYFLVDKSVNEGWGKGKKRFH